MKIDKVVFACSPSEEYSPFWNIQAEIFSKMGIEPVCLLFGKKSDTSMAETYGKIVEMETDPSLPWVLQLTWSKFDYPANEPDTTWLMGDIDLVPLQRHYFTTRLAPVPDDMYVHLNASGISGPRLGMLDGFIERGPQVLGTQQRPGTDVPGHYHVAKGRHFSNIYRRNQSFHDQVRFIADAHKYGLGPAQNQDRPTAGNSDYWYYWCAEEMRSSQLLWETIQAKSVNFLGSHYNNANDHDRINRDCYDGGRNDYVYTTSKVVERRFVDIHCARPYAKQAESLRRILDLSGMMA